MWSDKKESIVRKKALFIISAAIVLALIIFLLRGHYVSDTLKSIVLPELEAASGQRVAATAIYINLFPLFIEAKDLRVFDQKEKDVLTAKKVKGYVDLTGLFTRNLSIRRLVIDEPRISTDRPQIEEIVRNVRAYLEKEREPVIKVKIKVIEIRKGNTILRDKELKGTADMKGLSGELILGENQRVKASVKELVLAKEGWPKIKCDVNTVIALKEDRVEIKLLEVGSYGSRFKGEGYYSKGQGILKTELALIVDSVKRIFNLGRRGDGRISAKGEIRLNNEKAPETSIQTDRLSPLLKLQAEKPEAQGFKDIFVELKLSGEFYIETLMEILKVNERIEGLVDLQGELTGYLSEITGSAKARIQKGHLYGVDIDSLTCAVSYRDGVMKFEKGSGSLYNGTAEADVSINLPVVDFFSVNVKFHSIDSKSAFKLIGWDPGIPAGKVDGELSTSGREFNPDGRFTYKSLSAEQRARIKGYQPPVDNVLYRIKEVRGNYSLRGDIISLANLQLNTSVSRITADGELDLAQKTLNLKSRLATDNISDLVLPYYREAAGGGEFSGVISGSFDNPKISGRALMSNVSIEGYKSDSISTDFVYQKNLLDVRESVFKASGEEHRIKGRISFPEAKELFEFSMPVYNLTAYIRNAEFGKAVRIFYKDFDGEGRLNGDIKIAGKDKEIDISGNVSVEKASAYNIPFDSGSAVIAYLKREFSLRKVKIARGKTVLTGEGRLSADGKFSYSASSDNFYLKDFVLDRISVPVDAVLMGQSEGRGTFDNPLITVNARVVGGTFKGRNMGGGTITARIQNRDISLEAAMFNDKMKLKGRGYLDEKLPWSAELSIQPGRYDFIVSSFLKDVPEDLQLNLEGRVEMKGDRKNITASANITHLALLLFGQNFSNDSPINFSVNNKKISLKVLRIKSGSTSFRVQGGLEIGREFDIELDGSSSLSPLKGLSKKIGYLKGEADFVLSVRGKWARPEINGGMNISNASFGPRDYATYLSSINGYVYVDGDRIVVERLSGKIGGGNANISGIVYLKAFLIKRFYLEARLDDITTTISKDFHVNFDGNLLYRGTMDAMSVTGDIKINRARYKEMVEWRTWLLTSKAVEKPKSEESVFEKAELNIRISGSENISIDNNIARAPIRIRGDVIIKGTVSSPILFGRLESTEGYAYFRNNEFRIIYASVDFADPNRIKPVINLTAETLVKGYNIRLNLEGQIDHFNLSLASDPHLEEVDILSLLTVGQLGKQLKGLEGGIGAGAATSFITGKVQDVLEERLRTITGLDRFQVEPYVSSTTGTVSPRVTVSKRLIGDKLFVTYANPIGSTEEQVIKVEYLLDKNISLIGVRDERGSLGGDVKFRFGFK